MILIESFRMSICIAEGLYSSDVDAVIGIVAIGCEMRAEDVSYETSLEKQKTKVKVMKSTRKQATNQGCHPLMGPTNNVQPLGQEKISA